MSHAHVNAEVEELWQDFHAVVNMTSRELRDWLSVEAASEFTEDLPEQLGNDQPLGMAVLHVLGKRKTDLTSGDLKTMQDVVDFVHDVRGDVIEDSANYEDALRRQLMDVGHDPLRPPTGG